MQPEVGSVTEAQKLLLKSTSHGLAQIEVDPNFLDTSLNDEVDFVANCFRLEFSGEANALEPINDPRELTLDLKVRAASDKKLHATVGGASV